MDSVWLLLIFFFNLLSVEKKNPGGIQSNDKSLFGIKEKKWRTKKDMLDVLLNCFNNQCDAHIEVNTNVWWTRWDFTFTPGKYYHQSYNDWKQNGVLIQDKCSFILHTLQTSF